MNNIDAIEILDWVLGRPKGADKNRSTYNVGISSYPDIEKEREALEMAIKALEENDRLISDNDGLNNQIDDLCENLAWYINERNRLLAKLKEAENVSK